MNSKSLQVSILIALRNEEKNIPRLLQGLNSLESKDEEYEILLGDDHSDDRTLAMLQDFAQQNGRVRVFSIPERRTDEKLLGKARVLHYLAENASGKYFLFTDADILLPEKWIEGMTEAFSRNNKLGVAIGVTGMKSRPLLAAFQGMEWMTTLYFLHLLDKLKVEGTGMGNNMAVSSEAYWAVGGFEGIPFSIVEDYAIYKAIIDHGFESEQLYNPKVLAYTVPPENFLKQRQRWITGGFQSKSYLGLLGLVQSLWIPLMILLFFYSPLITAVVLGIQFLLNVITVYSWQAKLQIRGYLRLAPLFIVYMSVAWLIQITYWVFAKEVEWKGRTYN